MEKYLLAREWIISVVRTSSGFKLLGQGDIPGLISRRSKIRGTGRLWRPFCWMTDRFWWWNIEKVKKQYVHWILLRISPDCQLMLGVLWLQWSSNCRKIYLLQRREGRLESTRLSNTGSWWSYSGELWCVFILYLGWGDGDDSNFFCLNGCLAIDIMEGVNKSIHERADKTRVIQNAHFYRYRTSDFC